MKNIMWLIFCVAIMCMGAADKSFAEKTLLDGNAGIGKMAQSQRSNVYNEYTVEPGLKTTGKQQGKRNTLNTNTSVGVDSGSQQIKRLPVNQQQQSLPKK